VTSVDKKIFKKLDELSLSEGFSCKMAAIHKGKLVYKSTYGKNYTYYDLASMTKSIFTGLYFLNSKIKSNKVSDFLPWLIDSKIRVDELLSHRSGLKAHKEHYRTLVKSSDPLVTLKKLLRQDAKELQNKAPIYSDLGYLLLYFIIQELEDGRNLSYVFEDLKKSLKIPKGIHFNLNNKAKYKKSLYAPTEICDFRDRKIQAESLDRNTWSIHGVSTHAGLFGQIDDMIGFYKTLKSVYSPSKFTTLAEGWTNGFMKPSKVSTAGKYFSKDSIGHVGFTGVSFWYDPKVDFYITILSNRTYPDRADPRFNFFRPWVHDFLYKEFVNEQPAVRKV